MFPLDLPVCICGKGDDPGAVLDILTSVFLCLSLYIFLSLLKFYSGIFIEAVFLFDFPISLTMIVRFLLSNLQLTGENILICYLKKYIFVETFVVKIICKQLLGAAEGR